MTLSARIVIETRMTDPSCEPEDGALTSKVETDGLFLLGILLKTQGSCSHTKLGKMPFGKTEILAIAVILYLRVGSICGVSTASNLTVLSVELGITLRLAEVFPVTQELFLELSTLAQIEIELYPLNENSDPSGFTRLAKKVASLPSSTSGEALEMTNFGPVSVLVVLKPP